MTDGPRPQSPPGPRAARALLDEKEPLARAVTDALYADMPGLMERYGARGRELCLQDMRYNLEHLIPAVELGEPELFAGYARWLADMLEARGVPTAEVVRSLELTMRVAHERLRQDEADAVADSVRAGLETLRRGAT